MRNIGKVNFDMKNFEEAKSNFEKSIELFTKVYGKEDPHVFYAMQGLGRVLHYAMETEAQSKEVEKHLLETLRRKEKYFRNREPGELDHYSIAHAMQQLGRYYQKVEDYEKAHHYFNESLEKKKRNWQRKYGTTKTVDIAVDMTNLARNYLLKDEVNRDLHEAEKLLVEAYEIKRGKMLPKMNHVN
ncbi:uncharacterized protein [Ptychodera flava]|uniref:uncharacterized protein n=1 Tax=Ptychodera flava TaxID=63121 RepID=UPI00396AA8BE